MEEGKNGRMEEWEFENVIMELEEGYIIISIVVQKIRNPKFFASLRLCVKSEIVHPKSEI